MKRLVWTFILLLPLLFSSIAAAQENRQISYGETVNGRISQESIRQNYFFEARQGDILSARLQPIEGNLDPVLYIVDASGAVLAASDDADGAYGAILDSIVIPQSGLFSLVVTRFGHALGVTEGRYELMLERIGLRSDAGAFLSYGDSVIGLVDNATPVLTYLFEGDRGDIVNIDMQRIGGNLDAYIEVEDEAGQIVTANDDDGGSLNAEITNMLILEPGIYTVKASRFGQYAGTSEGSFVLSIDTAPTSGQGLSRDAALFLRYGDEQSNTIDNDHPRRFYTFGATRGDIITIAMTRTSNTIDPLVILLDSDGIPLAEDDDEGPSNNALLSSYIIPESGMYFIMATRFEQDEGETNGDFTLQLDGITGQAPIVAPGTLTILPNSAVIGTITDDNHRFAYAFLGNEGDQITLEMVGTREDDSLDPLLYLFASDSTQLAEDDDSGPGNDAKLEFTLPENGTYYVIATRFELHEGRTSGAYRLSLTVSDTPTIEAN